MRYYFAYGSNLNLAQMKSRCLEAKVIGTTVLNDYQLVFKTHLDVVPKKDSTVPIGIFFISSSDEAALDRYEGVEAKYYEKKEITVEFGNQKITGLIYVMTDQNPNALKGWRPSDKYYETCKQGYRDFNFDQKYLEDAYKTALKSTQL